MRDEDMGILMNANNIKLQRANFKQMCKFVGVQAQYRKLIPGTKQYNLYGELDAHFEPAIKVGCIWDEHPKMSTMKMLGWNAEIADGTVVIHVPYDLDGLQAGCIFLMPSGIDNAPPRMFKVLRISTIAVYPASVSCELGPLLTNTTEQAVVNDFKDSNMNVLGDESEQYGY